jgi:hypothetical protein
MKCKSHNSSNSERRGLGQRTTSPFHPLAPTQNAERAPLASNFPSPLSHDARRRTGLKDAPREECARVVALVVVAAARAEKSADVDGEAAARLRRRGDFELRRSGGDGEGMSWSACCRCVGEEARSGPREVRSIRRDREAGPSGVQYTIQRKLKATPH